MQQHYLRLVQRRAILCSSNCGRDTRKKREKCEQGTLWAGAYVAVWHVGWAAWWCVKLVAVDIALAVGLGAWRALRALWARS